MSITIKRPAVLSQSKELPLDYHIQIDSQGFPQLKELSHSKLLPGSATIKSTDEECQREKKQLQDSITIKSTFRSVTIKRTSKEYHNLNNCKEVTNSKWSATLKRTTLEYHNQSV